MIKIIFSGATPTADRVRYLFCIATVIATMLIRGKSISKRNAHTFLGMWIELIVFGTIISGIVIRLLSIKERGVTLFVSLGFAFILSVAPALVAACAVHWKEVKEKIKSLKENFEHLINNIKDVIKSLTMPDK